LGIDAFLPSTVQRISYGGFHQAGKLFPSPVQVATPQHGIKIERKPKPDIKKEYIPHSSAQSHSIACSV
jgi:hypothetical protein